MGKRRLLQRYQPPYLTGREDGVRKVLAGITTPDEVIRATVGDET